jgi:DNA replication protein DnaC
MSLHEQRNALAADIRASLLGAEAPIEPTDTDAMTAGLREMMSKMTPSSPAQIREYDFKNTIAPRLNDFGFDGRYQKLDLLSGPDPRCRMQESVLAGLRTMFRNRGAIVALVGPRGTGKTSIAAQLAAERLWQDWALACDASVRGNPCRVTLYRKLGELVARLKAYYGDFGTTQMERMTAMLDNLCSVECLIIDEVHEVPDDSKHKERLLTDIIDRRYAAKRDTLLISNQKKDEFCATLNASALSRLNEHGGIVRCEWASFRETPPLQ